MPKFRTSTQRPGHGVWYMRSDVSNEISRFWLQSWAGDVWCLSCLLTLCANLNMSEDSMRLKIWHCSCSFICFVNFYNVAWFFSDSFFWSHWRFWFYEVNFVFRKQFFLFIVVKYHRLSHDVTTRDMNRQVTTSWNKRIIILMFYCRRKSFEYLTLNSSKSFSLWNRKNKWYMFQN